MVHETIQYSQELSGEAQETCHRVQKSSLDPNVTVLNATKYASFMVIRIILPFKQFRSPGISGNFKPFLHTFLGTQEYQKYQYYHQKKSRKWTNMPRKRVRSARRSRNPVWESRKRITSYTEGLHKPRKCMN